MLIYRVTLPTYVDPMALAGLSATAPSMLYGTQLAINALGASTTQPPMRFLNPQPAWDGPEARRVQF